MSAVTEIPTVPYGDVVRMPVHFDDLDAMGVLHNARYAVLVERAIVLWWTERGVTLSSPDSFNVVREYSITFHRPVRSTGEVSVHFWVQRMGTTSADYRFRVTSTDGATVYAEGRRVNVRLDPATMRPTAWTEEGRATAATLLHE